MVRLFALLYKLWPPLGEDIGANGEVMLLVTCALAVGDGVVDDVGDLDLCRSADNGDSDVIIGSER